MRSALRSFLAAAPIATIVAHSAGQTAYLVFPIPDLPAEAVASSLTGVSDDGVCTGVWFDDQGHPTAFTWVLDSFDPAAAGYHDEGIWWERERGDINDKEHWANSTKQTTAFHTNTVRTPAYWIPGSAQFSIGHLGAERGSCRGLSDNDEAVGWSETTALDPHGNRIVSGFTWNATDGMSQVSGLTTFTHFSINDIHPGLDITVGTAWDWGGIVSESQLPPLGTEMHAADSSAVIVSAGVSEPLDNRLPASSAWHITGANAINSHQWIAGSAQGADGRIRAVLMVPNRADTDRDGLIAPNDFAGYLHHYISNSTAADLNGDGVTNVMDIESYIERYKAGVDAGTTDAVGTAGTTMQPRRVPVNRLRANSSNC